eukprot:TRINITY_DN3947_c0_g1_i1.p2 TRINITY_DN3947_c0_g1~~TRINITY_DN3947_c0_g1_i1.p2  ORF type:complete len:187 (+),score=61.72 TRINITY_DN3947_c0_g1_i1:562-1122(+)
MLSGHPPFAGKNNEAIMRNVALGYYTFKGSLHVSQVDKVWKEVSPDAIKFIKRLLTYDSKQRPTAEEALNDIWILKHENHKVDSCYMLKTISNLKKFKHTLLTQKTVLAYIAARVMIKERKEKVRETFSILDTNNDGTISKEELAVGLKMLEDEKVAKKNYDEVMNNIDINKNGTIDYNGIICVDG